MRLTQDEHRTQAALCRGFAVGFGVLSIALLVLELTVIPVRLYLWFTFAALAALMAYHARRQGRLARVPTGPRRGD